MTCTQYQNYCWRCPLVLSQIYHGGNLYIYALLVYLFFEEDSNIIGKDFNTLSISWVMLCFQESKMKIILFVERATFTVNFSMASRYKWANLCLLQGGVSLNLLMMLHKGIFSINSKSPVCTLPCGLYNFRESVFTVTGKQITILEEVRRLLYCNWKYSVNGRPIFVHFNCFVWLRQMWLYWSTIQGANKFFRFTELWMENKNDLIYL